MQATELYEIILQIEDERTQRASDKDRFKSTVQPALRGHL
jgi:hypothetical protein